MFIYQNYLFAYTAYCSISSQAMWQNCLSKLLIERMVTHKYYMLCFVIFLKMLMIVQNCELLICVYTKAVLLC